MPACASPSSFAVPYHFSISITGYLNFATTKFCIYNRHFNVCALLRYLGYIYIESIVLMIQNFCNTTKKVNSKEYVFLTYMLFLIQGDHAPQKKKLQPF